MKSYDTTVTRMMLTLTKLSNNEQPTMQELADEFNVSLRTMQRDITRLAYFPIEKTKDKKLVFIDGFSLDRSTLQKSEMMLAYLALSMVKENTPELSKLTDGIFSKLLKPNFFSPFFIEKKDFEVFDIKQEPALSIIEAIEKKRISTLTVKEKTYEVEPYKLVTFNGYWYLFAKNIEEDKITTFMFFNIKKFKMSQREYTLDKPIDEILDNVHSAWFDEGHSYEVLIKVKPEVSQFFKARKQLSSQEVLKEYKDGSLEISFQVSHDEDVDNLIKSWLPHIEVLKPTRFRDKIKVELEKYLHQF